MDDAPAPGPDAEPSAPPGGTGAPEVAVIVVNWNTRALTERCLRSVLRHARCARLELIVVDNGSGDGSAAALAAAFPQARLVANADNRGFAAACNQGLALRRARHAWLLNSDACLHDDALLPLLAALAAAPDVGLVGSALRYPDGRLQGAAGRFPSPGRELLALFDLGGLSGKLRAGGAARLPAPFLSAAAHARSRDVDWVAGASMLVRDEALAAVGGLDEAIFLFAEEWDWCRRMAQAGWRVRYCAESVVEHVGSASMSPDEGWRVRALLDGYGYFLAKHDGQSAWRAFRAVRGLGSALKLLGWTAALLLALPAPTARALCRRRLSWNARALHWSLRPSAGAAARRAAHARAEPR